jgi:hypothetical protein
MLDTGPAGIFTGGLIGPIRVPRPDGAEISHRKRDIPRCREVAVGIVGGFAESLGDGTVIPSTAPDEPHGKKTDDRTNSSEATRHTRTNGIIWIDGTNREERWSNPAGRGKALI